MWKHEFEGGRAFYTGLGHTQDSYKDPLYQKMIAEAIEWACGASKRRS
jgi:type 1 glutamine amidotransferase